MKYIRTKDGKTFYGPIDKKGRYKCANIYGWKIIKPFWNNIEIVKQSDTIEELCDEFVTIVDNRKPYNFPVYDEKQVKHYLHDCYDKEHCIIFGAIWTDKGLIYVAKMNEKGELELL